MLPLHQYQSRQYMLLQLESVVEQDTKTRRSAAYLLLRGIYTVRIVVDKAC